MSDWIEVFNASFWITLGGALFAFLGLTLRICLKSRCNNVNLCYGLISIQRDIDAEVELEEHAINSENESKI
jgi:hypothetical protein